MRLIFIVIVATLAAVGAVSLWTPKGTSDLVFTGAMVGTALGLSVLAWIVGAWLRNRQRRRLMEMQDSALW